MRAIVVLSKSLVHRAPYSRIWEIPKGLIFNLLPTDDNKKKYTRLAGLTIFSLSLFLLRPDECMAIANPAAQYCTGMGYQFVIRKDTLGSEYGLCLFPDGSSVRSWEFYKGKDGQAFSYCKKKGYNITTRTIHKGSYQLEYAVCVSSSAKSLPSGSIPMLELMEQNGDSLLKNQALLRFKPSVAQEAGKAPLKKQSTLLPRSFDWRNKDGYSYIGPIRSQGACGDCYAFSAAAAAEGTFNYAKGKYDTDCADFSESFITWCLGEYGPYSSHFGGCEGADYEYAELGALTKEGITWENYFPYTENDPGSCTHWNDPVVMFEAWNRIAPNDIDTIKTAIITYGVLDVAVQAADFFLMYVGGIYSDNLTTCPDGAYTKTNHAVALVGWGYDATYGEYWLLRNSWGASWGENGYMRIQLTSARIACSATYLRYNSTSPEPSTIVLPGIKMLLLKQYQ